MKKITEEEYKLIIETLQRLNFVGVSGSQNIEHLFFSIQNLRGIINRVESKPNVNDEEVA